MSKRDIFEKIPFSLKIGRFTMSNIREALVAIVKEKKKLRQITQNELARRVGCHQSHISEMLSGDRRISSEMLEKICAALGVKLSDLEQWSPELAEIRFSDASKGQSQALSVSGSVSGNAIVGNAIVGSSNGSVAARNSKEQILSAEAAELVRIYESLDVKLRMKLLESAFSLEEQQKAR